MPYRLAAFALLLPLVGCGAGATPPVPALPLARSSAIDVPEAPEERLLSRVRVASGLANPRGMHVLPDGALLVSEAGTGQEGSGRLLRLRDRDGDGDFEDDGEREVLLDRQPSRNIVDIVRRDEVFGMAGIAEGDGTVLATLAFFGGPTTIFRVSGDEVTQWGSTHGNLNDIAYDPTRHAWVATASTSDEIVRLREGGGVERLAKLPPLAQGQDAVPGYLRHEPGTGALLVSLFSGSPQGEEGGEGTELVPRAGVIVRVDPDTRGIETVVSGLTAPTGLEIGPAGEIYVLELCRSFLDAAPSIDAMRARPSHGGFEHFSGRLLRVDPRSRSVVVVADRLDTPTNLALAGRYLYVAQGMGTPGRPIPVARGSAPLEGFIERIEIE